MTTRPFLRRGTLAAGAAALALLAACGGGSDADGTHITLDAFALSAGTLSAPGSGSTDFSATWSTTTGGLASTVHYVTAHAVPAGIQIKRWLFPNCRRAADGGQTGAVNAQTE